jgi:hypothetical protein
MRNHGCNDCGHEWSFGTSRAKPAAPPKQPKSDHNIVIGPIAELEAARARLRPLLNRPDVHPDAKVDISRAIDRISAALSHMRQDQP